jgi:hypothetical protein
MIGKTFCSRALTPSGSQTPSSVHHPKRGGITPTTV